LKELQCLMDRQGMVTGFSLILDNPRSPVTIEEIRHKIETMGPELSGKTRWRVSAIICSRMTEDTSERKRRKASVSATSQINSSVGPVRSGYWSIARRRFRRLQRSTILSSPELRKSSRSTSHRGQRVKRNHQ
jgi:hypothetical protein